MDIYNLKSILGLNEASKPAVTDVEAQPASAATDRKPKDNFAGGKVRKLFNKFGQFPAKYRASIWKQQLGLPNNHNDFARLTNKGFHPSIDTIKLQNPDM